MAASKEELLELPGEAVGGYRCVAQKIRYTGFRRTSNNNITCASIKHHLLGELLTGGLKRR